VVVLSHFGRWQFVGCLPYGCSWPKLETEALCCGLNAPTLAGLCPANPYSDCSERLWLTTVETLIFRFSVLATLLEARCAETSLESEVAQDLEVALQNPVNQRHLILHCLQWEGSELR
jgi:hypothetical protein